MRTSSFGSFINRTKAKGLRHNTCCPKPRFLSKSRKTLTVRKFGNRFGQIRVSTGVLRNKTPDKRDDLMKIKVEKLLHREFLGIGKLQNKYSYTLLQYTYCFSQCVVESFENTFAKRHCNGIICIVVKLKAFRFTLLYFNFGRLSLLLDFFFRHLQHSGGDLHTKK